MKYLSIFKYVLIGVSVLTVILYFVGASDVDLMLRWMYILTAATLLAAILFPLFNIVKNPKGAVRSLVGLAVVLVVCGIAYAFSSDAPITNVAGKVYDSPALLKLTDVGLYVTYAAMVIVILVIIVGEIRNAFK